VKDRGSIDERTVTHLREGTVADVVSVAPEELAPNGLRRDRISLPTWCESLTWSATQRVKSV
jgi:hypothetical protein